MADGTEHGEAWPRRGSSPLAVLATTAATAWSGVWLVLCLVIVACGSAVPSSPVPQAAVAPSAPRVLPAPALSALEIEAEAGRLREALAREVASATGPGPWQEPGWAVRARAAAAAAGLVLDRPQLLLSVDRGPGVQALAILLARPDGAWEVLGGSRVSTGQANRRGYYITPTGVFLHTSAILDWRAEGTFNEHHIRGLGLRGMRVWDFGWVPASKGWRADREMGEIRFLLHATDPDQLEPRLGQPASKGCVRIPAAMNRFLDRHGVLDADHEQAAATDARFQALLLPDREPTPLAGRALVVIDSSETF